MTDDTGIDLGIDGLGPAEHIGRGGFADVYRAEQLSQRRIVAVKVLRAQVTDEEAEARFERECYAIGSVSDHPHIVGVHEGGFTRNGRAYLVMEYLPGGSLLNRLERFGVMSPADVVQIGMKIGSALHVAHRAGVLHRDVKPANIMISKDGEPALGDFGLAQIAGGHQPTSGFVTSSFLHSAPEVLEGQPATPAADIYSLASTMYQLVGGTEPYFESADESVWPALQRMLTDPLPSPSAYGMSPEFCQLFDRATARNPNLRYRDGGEFAGDLRQINPGSVRDRDDANLRAELRAAAGEAAPSGGHPIDLATEAPFLDHRLGIEPAPTADIGGPPRAEFKARPKPTAPVTTGAATPIGKPDVTTISSAGNRAPLDVRSSGSQGSRTGSSSGGSQGQFDHEWDAYDRRTSNRVGLKALAVVFLSVMLVAAVLFGVFRVALWGASEFRAAQSESGQTTDNSASEAKRLELAVPATSSAVLLLPEATLGPLVAGQSYAPSLSTEEQPGSVRLLVDGQLTETVTEFVAPTGRHVLQAEILTGVNAGITAPIDVFGLQSQEDNGFQVNLDSSPANQEEWPGLLETYDQLVFDGHANATIGVESRLAGSTWWIFVPGFGADSAAAESYCRTFGLLVPAECFVGPSLISEATE